MDNREKSYAQAVKEAKEEFKRRDPSIMAKASDTEYREGSHLLIPLMYKDYRVYYPSGEIEGEDGRDVSLPYQILLLHYLIMSRGLPLKGRLISFKEIPGGLVYYDAFYRRAIEPLVKAFGSSPKDFSRAGHSLGGEELELGDISFSFSVLPKVPITTILWRGDEEHQPRVSILFDAVSKNYLPMEDLALLASIPVWSLLKAR